jgi:hypothetical protein
MCPFLPKQFLHNFDYYFYKHYLHVQTLQTLHLKGSYEIESQIIQINYLSTS